jgi:hypothetical protein
MIQRIIQYVSSTLKRIFNTGFHNSKWFYLLLFITVFILINARQSRITNFGCEICADKAGYYMYLPAIFHLGFGASNYEDGFDNKHGDGFRIDRENDKIITKFTSGLAMLLLPFYALGTLIASIFGFDAHPYSGFYLFFVNIGAAFYLALGLFFLRKWLNFYVDSNSSLYSVLLIFFGTNLYYYTLDETLMSHLYSFTMFSTFLYGLKSFYETKKWIHFLLFATSLSIAILIRPTNALFGLIGFFIDLKSFSAFKSRLLLLLDPKYLFPGVIIFVLIMMPQFLYWKFAFGEYIVWSYEGEGFTYWSNPQFLTVWFSPQSGLFTYTPILLISLLFSAIMIAKKNTYTNSTLVIISFLAVSYMCASWNNPYFGICNFGKRPMVEYLPILFLPIPYIFSSYNSFRKTTQYIILASMLLMVIYNLALFRAFDTCFFGETWEWEKFGQLVKKAFLF